jgi:uncharacterized membrane protein required for colicin V production
MEYIVDIIIAVIFGAIVISSIRKGFFMSLFELAGTLISLAISRILSASFAPVAFDSFIRKGAETYLEKALGSVGTKDYALQAQETLNSIPEALNGIMSLMGIDKELILEKIKGADLGGSNMVESLMSSVIEPVGIAILQFVLFIVLTVAVGFILKAVVRLLDGIIKKLPAVKQLNTTLGAVFGVLRGIIVVAIITMLVGILASFIGNETFIETVNNSIIVDVFQKAISTISGAKL